MSHILHIETATTVCSVAISKNDELLFFKELNEGFTHAENLHLFIKEALKEAKLEIHQLSAISVSKGPGSYTGLRIGVSAAKGLAYSLEIPLISVETLRIMALSAFSYQKEPAFYCPMIDARRMEVYTSVYNGDLNRIEPIEALIVDEQSISRFKSYSKIFFFGDGMPKCKSIIGSLSNAHFIENVYPSAKYMCKPVWQKFLTNDFEDVAYFEPFYLKDFLIVKKESKTRLND
jgi:tRNA threonylcarbamoyladenosine biosynthesis protein TsaB